MNHPLAAALSAAVLALLSTAAQAACQLSKVLELPITLSGTHALANVKINGTDARLILDTGAFFSILSPDAAAQLNLPTRRVPGGLRVEGLSGVATPEETTVQDFTIGRTTLHRVDFLITGNEIAGESSGILAQNFLRLADDEFDLANGVVRMMRQKGCGDANLAYWAGSQPYSVLRILPTDTGSPDIITTVAINGVDTRVMLDSGAVVSMLSTRAAARAGITPQDAGTKPGGSLHGLGGRKGLQSWIVPVKSFKFDNEDTRNTRLRIVDIDPLPENAEMLLGADFFLSHRIYIAYSLRKIFITYNGGPVFDLRVQRSAPEEAPAGTQEQASASSAPGPSTSASSASGAPEPASPAPASSAPGLSAPNPAPAVAASAIGNDSPTDAAGFDRRGAALAARGELASALADFGRAVQLDPTESLYRYHRAQVLLLLNRQTVLAMGDLDQAIRLEPGFVPALVTRAELRLRNHDEAGARADFAAAEAHAPQDVILPLREAAAYAIAGRYPAALEVYSRWIDAHPHDERLFTALEGRCAVRTYLGLQPDAALADCNAALKQGPKTWKLLMERGLAHLRRGEFDLAIADDDAALKLQPGNAAVLYSRGLAETRKGLKAQGDADIHAALALAPSIIRTFDHIGMAH